MTAADVDALLARSNALGADKRVTNWGGGNTSCKTIEVDPATQQPVDVMFVKGSGGDIGTLTREGLSCLTLDRLLALKGAYRGEDHEDEMVGLMADHCRFGPGGAAPSIDTAMHGLLPETHVDHLHPDSVIALAAAADGEQLTKECYGDEVAWVPWRRPGFELALQMEQLHRDRPDLKGVVLGGHGLTAWGETSEECGATSLELIARAERFIAERGRTEPLGPVVPELAPLPDARRRELAAALSPVVRGLASTDGPMVGCFRDDDLILDYLSRAGTPAVVAKGTSCPDHFLRTKVRPLLLDVPADGELDDVVGRLRELHEASRDADRAYYERHATPTSPAMRGADPTIVLVPGVGMWSFGADAFTARIAGEYYVNAINVIKGAEALSTYEPVPEDEKFRIEYWELEEAKLKRRPKPKPLTGRIALVTGAGSGIGRAIALRLAAEGACVVVSDRDETAAAGVAGEIATGITNADSVRAVPLDVTDEAAVDAAFDEACLAFGGFDLVVNNAGLSISKPLVDTTVADWDVQHDVMARGSFLVSRAAARRLVAQGRGGDIVYIVSKNALAAGPNNVAYGAAKANQAHQVRLLAAELGEHGVRVNGVNPDGVVRGSGIFASGWGADRAKVYGVPEEDLGQFYAQRTLLKTEVLPDHIAAAVFAIVGGDLPLTTGLLVPVDGGVPMAFLR